MNQNLLFIVCQILPREGISEKDLKKIKEKVNELAEVEHKQIIIPDKVVITKNQLYFVFPLNKDKPFIEAFSKIKSERIFGFNHLYRGEKNENSKVL